MCPRSRGRVAPYAGFKDCFRDLVCSCATCALLRSVVREIYIYVSVSFSINHHPSMTYLHCSHRVKPLGSNQTTKHQTHIFQESHGSRGEAVPRCAEALKKRLGWLTDLSFDRWTVLWSMVMLLAPSSYALHPSSFVRAALAVDTCVERAKVLLEPHAQHHISMHRVPHILSAPRARQCCYRPCRYAMLACGSPVSCEQHARSIQESSANRKWHIFLSHLHRPSSRRTAPMPNHCCKHQDDISQFHHCSVVPRPPTPILELHHNLFCAGCDQPGGTRVGPGRRRAGCAARSAQHVRPLDQADPGCLQRCIGSAGASSAPTSLSHVLFSVRESSVQGIGLELWRFLRCVTLTNV